MPSLAARLSDPEQRHGMIEIISSLGIMQRIDGSLMLLSSHPMFSSECYLEQPALWEPFWAFPSYGAHVGEPAENPGFPGTVRQIGRFLQERPAIINQQNDVVLLSS